MTEKVGRARFFKILRRVRANLKRRIDRERRLNEQVHDLFVTHARKVGGDHSYVDVTPFIRLSFRMRAKKNGLLDANLLSEKFYCLSDDRFRVSCRLSR